MFERTPTPIPPEYENHPAVESYRLSKVEERLANGAKAFGSMRNWIAVALITSLGACVIVGISIGTKTERLDRLVTQIAEQSLALAKLSESVAELKISITGRSAKIEVIEDGLRTLRVAFEDFRQGRLPGRPR